MSLDKLCYMTRVSGYAYVFTERQSVLPHYISRVNERTIIIHDPIKMRHIIGIRGSMFKHSPRDILINSDIKQVSFMENKVHRGYFNEAFLVLKAIRRHIGHNYTIDLTGHSSGGCIAILLASMLHDHGWDISDVISFGQPKFINTKADFPFSIKRINDTADPVPLIPINGLNHTGTEILLVNDDNVHLKYHELRNYQQKLEMLRKI